ncbi:basic helix-loop-helix (bHLH) DNA-binding superfamily protein [Euphorbia peplus]|nr:basic helix-loop-helix (bHLH) DNA-binding superfamily protein [Euphorbia peplus]
MAAPPNSRLQNMLQAAVQSVQWTYSLFWQICPQQGILVWRDGYYNGAIKTRKTVQPIEVSTEESCLQRSQQLKELYESLSAGETNQPARRPCAALSPEDLTESEWFYLMCVSFNFPPGVGLPGKAYSRRQHVWLTGANEIDSKTFSRAILAKSAGIQTVVCIPLLDGVVEFGITEKIEEDPGFVHRVKGFFTDHQHHPPLPPPKPAISEQSTSNPATSSHQLRFHSRIPAMYAAAHPPNNAGQEDDDEDEDEEDGSDSEAETGRNIGSVPMEAQHAQGVMGTIAEPSELMQVEMSEDIRLGSPDDGSTHLDSDFNLIGSQIRLDHQSRSDSFRAESVRRWGSEQDPLNNNIQQTPLGSPPLQEIAQEDTHYSQTVTTILQRQPLRWADSSTARYAAYSNESAFAKWTNLSADHILHVPLEGTSQWFLKYILFSVPYLHHKYRDENSPKSRDGDSGPRFRKSAPQEELSANHVMAERRRREKLNERFIILRSLVPFVTKMDKASILGDTIEYVKQLRKKIQDLETRNRQMEIERRSKSAEPPQRSSSMKEQRSGVTTERARIGPGPVPDKKKLKIVEDNGKQKAVSPEVETNVEVSIIESDALVELECGCREGLLLDIMQTLRDIRIETTAVQSSSSNGVFSAELRAKVKDNVTGKRVSIMEVKRAIRQIIPLES